MLEIAYPLTMVSEILVGNGTRRMESLESPTPQQNSVQKPSAPQTLGLRPLSPAPSNLAVDSEMMIGNGGEGMDRLESPTPQQQPVLKPSVPQTSELPPVASAPGKHLVPNISPPLDFEVASSASQPETLFAPPDPRSTTHRPEFISPYPQRDAIYNILDEYNRDSILSFSTSDQSDSDAASEADEVDYLTPPQPIFDLTPGRESSPARYKHGEPLEHGEL